jgi:hypothetical protein
MEPEMKSWPRHPDGTEKMFAELSAAEKQTAPVCRRLIRETVLFVVDSLKFRLGFRLRKLR